MFQGLSTRKIFQCFFALLFKVLPEEEKERTKIYTLLHFSKTHGACFEVKFYWTIKTLPSFVNN